MSKRATIPLLRTTQPRMRNTTPTCHKFAIKQLGTSLKISRSRRLAVLYTAYIRRPMQICMATCRKATYTKKTNLFLRSRGGMLACGILLQFEESVKDIEKDIDLD